MGPIGVLLQSKDRMRSPISPPPGNILDGEIGFMGTSNVSILESWALFLFHPSLQFENFVVP
jgi:hypothetical protein